MPSHKKPKKPKKPKKTNKPKTFRKRPKKAKMLKALTHPDRTLFEGAKAVVSGLGSQAASSMLDQMPEMPAMPAMPAIRSSFEPGPVGPGLGGPGPIGERELNLSPMEEDGPEPEGTSELMGVGPDTTPSKLPGESWEKL